MNFTPDGRMVGKDKNLDDKIDDKFGGKIMAMIKLPVHPLVGNMKEFVEKNIF